MIDLIFEVDVPTLQYNNASLKSSVDFYVFVRSVIAYLEDLEIGFWVL